MIQFILQKNVKEWKAVIIMQKTDKTIIKETKYIAACVVILSILMQAVFMILQMWSYKVLLSNLLIGATVIANFYFMGLGVQKAVAQDEKEAKKTIQASQTIRTLFVFVMVVIGVTVPCFSIGATIIPLFFPRIAIALRPLWKEKKSEEGNG